MAELALLLVYVYMHVFECVLSVGWLCHLLGFFGNMQQSCNCSYYDGMAMLVLAIVLGLICIVTLCLSASMGMWAYSAGNPSAVCTIYCPAHQQQLSTYSN